jgi:hypothetical protein
MLVVERTILKFAAVSAAFWLGLTAPVAAAPPDDDHFEAASSRYDSPEVIRKIGSIRRSRERNCFECQLRRSYDDQEVVKKVRNVDHSRVINTVTVVPSRRVREVNRLVIRKNETRHIGVVRHNHIIVEKEIRYVQRAPSTTTVNFVTHKYRVIERPAAVAVSVVSRRNYECGVGFGRYQGSCGPTLRVRN